MSATALPALDEEVSATPAELTPWQTVVWNDPVNLMSYVTHVFRTYFGYPPARAQALMLAVHHDGHAVVAEGAREQMERHVHAMHEFGLTATVRLAPR